MGKLIAIGLMGFVGGVLTTSLSIAKLVSNAIILMQTPEGSEETGDDRFIDADATVVSVEEG